MKLDQIAAAEHLKEYTREIIYAYKDGAGHPDAPITAELAVSAIWRKIDQAFEAFNAEALKGTLRFRLEVELGAEPPAFLDVITCRCLGAACWGKNTQVYYVVCKAQDYDEATEIVKRFVANGLLIRDWEYYGS